MTIHAYTEPRGPLPAYINISERVSNPGDVIVTVRSNGENNASTIVLTGDQLELLAFDALKFLDSKILLLVNPPAPAGGSMITFADFVLHGRRETGNLNNGMPWSFQYLGHPVTHENDQCYLVGSQSLRFTPDDVLRTNAMGELSVEPLAKATPIAQRTKSG